METASSIGIIASQAGFYVYRTCHAGVFAQMVLASYGLKAWDLG